MMKYMIFALLLLSAFSRADTKDVDVCEQRLPYLAHPDWGVELNLLGAECVITEGNINSYETAVEYYLSAYGAAIKKGEESDINLTRMLLAIARANLKGEDIRFDLYALYDLKRIDKLKPRVEFYLGMVGYNTRGKPESVFNNFNESFVQGDEWAAYGISLLKRDPAYSNLNQINEIDTSNVDELLPCWLNSLGHKKFRISRTVKRNIGDCNK